MVNSRLLKELRIDVRYSVWWSMIPYIRLFEALPAEELPSLQLLEIKDMVRNTDRHFWDPANNANRWRDHGRDYCNLVSPFLPLLSNLTSLWVDERVLLPPSASLQELFLDPQCVEVVALRAVLSRLTSLRVGFGRMKEADVALVLGLCDPAKLTQFGFKWDWQTYGKDEPLSAGLCEHLRKFSLLNDVHILFPRPDAEFRRTLTIPPMSLGFSSSCRLSMRWV
uniref:F-box domain-containing protein n=1 Tax=Mycena chlorophos TaxID=658473 RepID=A0ABQ0LA56_MYCCL|nr:predicted protein [Mycena chlorophos]